MKTDIHPNYVQAEVRCACGNAFVTRSVKPLIKLEICSACHPYYTGTQKLLDTAGRVERFQKRFAKTSGQMVKREPIKKAAPKKINQPKARVLTTTPTKKGKEGGKDKAPKAK